MSGDHGHEHGPADPTAPLHSSCVTDTDAPTFDAPWQRRAFGLAVALSEFDHYPWEAFQQELIGSIGSWEAGSDAERSSWEYYTHWLAALEKVVVAHGIVDEAELAHRVAATARD
jgi:nitrile hydratase accessory protein